MAIDREALVRRLFTADDVPPLAALLPESLVAAPVQPSWSHLSVEERLASARALLADAGYGPDRALTLNLRLPAGRGHAIVAAAVAADWQALGVETKLVTEAETAHARAVTRSDFDLAVVERVSPVDTPWALLAPLGCTARIGGYCNKDADALVAAALTVKDPAKRVEALEQAQSLMLIDTPMISLFVPVRWSLVSPQVSGWVDNTGGHHPLARLGKTQRRRLIN
jgi:ABC-type transport system substrate-binding protein